ncbi:kinase [Sparassis latifolia]|uniref:MAP kinase kinase kinase wis4 n=1 Tax=Sparassis crispa TaxID=139825 RepID=A0A401G896_9APHY|nr:MAP kinase kinase kinase wis4 [Sparassis crispa]GBE78410.1 MAP kinase kinase kinase wis4 [Sparassis crispa]
MKRHTPTLYTHPEHDADSGLDGSWSSASSRLPSSLHSTGSKGRSKIKQRSAFAPGPNVPLVTSLASSSSVPERPSYPNVYNQFLRRYRSGRGVDDDPRNEPDSHFYQRGLGQLLDIADSDDEELRGTAVGASGEVHDRLSSLMLDAEPIEPETLEDRERLEWQTMLASVLAGDVLKAENTRIAVALKSSLEEENNVRSNIWLGIRARLQGTTEEEERKRLEERRLRIGDAILKEVLNFRVTDLPSDSTESLATHALREVSALLRRLDVAHSLYSSLRSFYSDYPAALDDDFQLRCDTLNTWSTVLTSLRQLLYLLRRWTGSEALDVTQPTSNPDNPFPSRAPVDTSNGTTFVDRLLKEESVQRQFEKGSMTTIHALVGTTRDAHVNLAPMFQKMNLPPFEQELVPLVSFLTNLAQAVLRVRLDYAQKLKNPDILIIDQLTEDLKVKMGFACTLKRQYEAFLIPDPGGNWNLPPCISEDYDTVILDTLTYFFKLIHWKLKSGAKGIHSKETDVIEAQWVTFSDVSLSIPGGASLVAEQLCALTNKLMVRVTSYFDTQIRIPTMNESPQSSLPDGRPFNSADTSTLQTQLKPGSSSSKSMTDEQVVGWYAKVLDGIKQRYRKLHRLARVLSQRFSNSAEYDLEDVPLDVFLAALIETDHFIILTQTFEEEGTYIIAPPALMNHPDIIRRMLLEAFQINELDEGSWLMETGEVDEDVHEETPYLLVLSPRTRFVWTGVVFMFQIPKFDLDLKDNRIRLITEGPQHRLTSAKRQFLDLFTAVDEEGEPIEPPVVPLTCLVEQQAHLPLVNRELRKISRASHRLAESIVDSVHHVRDSLRDTTGYQELLENWYSFASEHGTHSEKFMEGATLRKFNRMLIKLAISWVSFICDDCDPNDRRTFRWAVTALEFTLHRTKRNNILNLPDDQFEMLRQKVASCMTLLISHFDILGARSTLEAKKEKERQEEMLRQQSVPADRTDNTDDLYGDAPADLEDISTAYTDPTVRLYWEKATRAIQEVEVQRSRIGMERHVVGRVLDEGKLVDRSLVFLAGSSANVSIRWQQGRFIGAGSFGSVYVAVNLDTGSLMAVKEIRFQEIAGLSNLYSQIKDELSVMEMLHHPNVVEYYGIEVHRDKVYIFEEYCQGGSLADLLEHGRIEDEGIIQIYTLQMVEGLAYLHSQNVVHRDIKPDNILLDHMGVIKFVDFGAAKILAKNQRSIQRSRRVSDAPSNLPEGGFGMNNSLTGTPMYMSPEVIRNSSHGRQGAMDIWSLGCVVLECATGKKPWSNLDNEWAIMFHIGVATQHPPLPDPSQLSEMGIDFIRQCLTIDPMRRPTAVELMNHPWMLDFRVFLSEAEEAELATNPPLEMPPQEKFVSASVARQAAIIQEKEVETIAFPSPSMSPVETPTDSTDLDQLLDVDTSIDSPKQ